MTLSPPSSCWSGFWRSGGSSGKKTTGRSTERRIEIYRADGNPATQKQKSQRRRNLGNCLRDGRGLPWTSSSATCEMDIQRRRRRKMAFRSFA
jgi:hypothetical protein